MSASSPPPPPIDAMNLTRNPKIQNAVDRVCLFFGVAFVIAICCLGMFAAVIRWHALDNWCAAQLEDQ